MTRLPPRDVIRLAATAIEAMKAGDRSGDSADEILTAYYGTDDYPVRALALANKLAGAAPERVLVDEKVCACPCGRTFRQRENESDRNFAQRRYLEQACYYNRNREDR